MNEDKINLAVYTVGGGLIGSALFAAATLGGQGITNAVTLAAGLGGGVISGLLTLQGVRKTIELQKEKELEDSKPKKIRSLHFMINLAYTYNVKLTMVRVGLNTILDDGDTKKLEELVNQWEKDKGNVDSFRDRMLEESLMVNPDIYFYLKKRIKKIEDNDAKMTSSIMTGTYFYVSDIKEEIKKIYEDSKIINAEIVRRLNEELDKYEKSLFSRES
ncbi:hypothetical protein bcere0025_41610 [Bacillus cereus F65185]|uniref:hypothetical protein n=1 Tax=Bacillus cereus TaxID=1396 RepID=UPI0001A0CFF0|nr:hypothetical protein [Bacillus cereus]EEL63118.1 hypothetical protein bcere0025_41610 [Bacillus cereus F65185]